MMPRRGSVLGEHTLLDRVRAARSVSIDAPQAVEMQEAVRAGDIAHKKVAAVRKSEEEDSTAPLTRFQVDCADAMMHLHDALMHTGDRSNVTSNMSDMYLVVAEVVNKLSAFVRTHPTDREAVEREIMEAKMGVFSAGMQCTFFL
jgi:hypothetical protein